MIRIAIVRNLSECCGFRDGIRAVWAEACLLAGPSRSSVPEALLGACVVETNRCAKEADCFQQVQRSASNTLQCLHREFERKSDGRLTGEIVSFAGLATHQRL